MEWGGVVRGTVTSEEVDMTTTSPTRDGRHGEGEKGMDRDR